jgi:hypothetical protein
MINEIAKAAGLELREARHPKPLSMSYGVYMDEVEAGGADGVNCLRTHNYTLEVYSPTAKEADDIEAAIEDALDERGIPWTKQGRYWLAEAQRYQEIYEFTHIEKRRINNGKEKR